MLNDNLAIRNLDDNTWRVAYDTILNAFGDEDGPEEIELWHGVMEYPRTFAVHDGELPIGTGDGIAFSATTDDNNKPLDGRCDVVVSGVTPAARFWTLTLFDRKGHVVANSLQRYGFTSQEIVRGSDGQFEIRVAARARAGNWLPTGGIERYALMLRLYDTPVGVATRTQRDAPMPSIATVGCP